MATADEGALFEALVASQRVGDWLQAIRAPNTARQRSALKQLEEWVLQSDAYAEEAHEAGAVAILTTILKRTEDEEMQSSAARVIAACSGPAVMPSYTRMFDYGPGAVVAVCEGMLGDGLGARVWLAAQALARTLVAAPQLVAGRRTLELGAGVGLVGLLAARLGAAQVTLTDYEPLVLRQLRRSMLASPAASPLASAADLRDDQQPQPASDTGDVVDALEAAAEEEAGDAEEIDWDPEDAESCDDLDNLLDGGGGNGGNAGGFGDKKGAAADGEGWDWDGIAVRRLDWCDALAALDGSGAADADAHAAAKAFWTACEPQQQGIAAEAQRNGTLEAGQPADLAGNDCFEVLLGSDLIYEAGHAISLAAAIARHLAPAGIALLCCPVREQEVFDEFDAQLLARRLSVETRPVEPLRRDSGIADQARTYEGGFQMYAIQHEGALPYSWPWESMLSWQEPE